MNDIQSPAVPCLGGADIELGNFIEGRYAGRDNCADAAQAILNEIDGYPESSYESSSSGSTTKSSPQDRCRRFLAPNGGCVYIDLDHTEICLPEITGARPYVTYLHAMLRHVRRAQVRANRNLPDGERIHVLVNNSDGQGHSYGGHMNLMISRRTFDNLFNRKLHHLLHLGSYQVSSMIFTGQGKVGSENAQPPVDFQIAQRADFFETLVGTQTTFNRPVVNMRDEALCGRFNDEPALRYARLHCIFYDANLCHVANYLKFGVMQIILAMHHEERIDTSLILDDPIAAAVAWSHDCTLRRRMPMMDGRRRTAVDLQSAFAESARRFVDAGRCAVPEAPEILDLWQDTLEKLGRGDLESLAPRLDWVLKRSIIRQAIDENPGLTWGGEQARYLDLLYGSLDPAEGLYLDFEQAGLVETIATDQEIDRAMTHAPEDTRAWGRAALLQESRRHRRVRVTAVDWDGIRFSLLHPDGYTTTRTVDMPDPTGLTRDEVARRLQSNGPISFRQMLERLDEVPVNRNGWTNATTAIDLRGGADQDDSAKPQ